MTTQISGRNVTISLGKGVVDLPSGRRMTVANGVFEIPDTQMKKPPARVRMRMEGPVPAAAELLAMDRLSEMSGSPLDPASSRGTVTAQVTLGLTIDPDAPKGSTSYTVGADVANFAVDKFMMSQRIEAQTLRVTANNQGYAGQGRRQDRRHAGERGVSQESRRRRGRGAPAGGVRRRRPPSLRLRPPGRTHRAGADPPRRPRARPAPRQDNRFAIEADLTQAKIDQLLPGWSKTAGKPAKATFTMATRPGKSTRIDDIAIEGSGGAVKGSIEIDHQWRPRRRQFPGLRASPTATRRRSRRSAAPTASSR